MTDPIDRAALSQQLDFEDLSFLGATDARRRNESL
jgi:hypothetical protein